MKKKSVRLKVAFHGRVGGVVVLLAFLLSHSILNAQEVIATGGNYHKSGDISISWTLGETVIETFSTSEKILTQGFQQAKLTVLSIDEIDLPGYNIIAFPNPACSYVMLNVEVENYEKVSYCLYDSCGRIIGQSRIESNSTNISFVELKPAVYFIGIFEDEKKLVTFKIIKK